MKSRLLSVFMLLVPLMAQAADDPILFTVGDMPVTRSEFEQSYLQNTTGSQVSHLTIADYLELYIAYKLKVKAALDAHIDATNSFKSEYARCLSEVPMSPVFSSQGHRASSSSVRTAYEKLRDKTGNDGLVCPAQILIRVPQKASREEQHQAQQQIESLYRQLQDGADFRQMARQYSQDKSSSEQGGVMGWYSHGQMLKEVEDVVFNMRKGELSRPFLSTIGYHIFLMADRKALEDYDTLRECLSAEVGQRQVHQQISTTPLWGDILKQTETANMDMFQMPSDGLQRTYYEGLLLYEQSKQSVGRQAAEDEEALKYYFKKHKKKYRRKGFKPKDYREVRELVVADLQEEMDKHWVTDLRKKYPVSVNKKVLKTVNNHR